MDLFSAASESRRQREAPLAARMRPRTLDEYIGQDEVVGEGRLLRRSIQADRLGSMIFYGPPGSGKTTLATVIANTTSAYYEALNAVTCGVQEIRRVIAEAKDRFNLQQQRTVVFIDEIHRFNKSQQDALLPAVEDGTILLIGATTENPYFEVNAPLISRCRIFRLRTLTSEEIRTLVEKAIVDKERGLGEYQVELAPDALEHLLQAAGGDARVALNGLELAVLTTDPDDSGVRHIDLRTIEDSLQQRSLNYDKDGQAHYDTISAFIKSMRGSDPQAAVYYLARMIEAGEDPRFIARRIVVHAAEDVGNADPQALLVATAAAQAVEFVGMPEAQIPLAQAVTYIATAPKSNAACVAIHAAVQDVREGRIGEIPPALRDAGHPGSKQFGNGVGYLYPHDYPGGFVPQQYLPKGLEDRRYYEPTDRGYERMIRERMEEWEKNKRDQGKI
jgi:putative ATPase